MINVWREIQSSSARLVPDMGCNIFGLANDRPNLSFVSLEIGIIGRLSAKQIRVALS